MRSSGAVLHPDLPALSSSPPAARARDALAATLAAGTARFVVRVAGGGGAGQVDMTMAGVVDFTARQSRSQIRSGDGSTEMVVNGSETLQLVPQVDDLPVLWMAWPAEPGTGEPTGLLSWLQAVRDATVAGEEILDGCPVTRLDAVVDTSAELPPAGRSIRDQLAAQVEAAGLDGTELTDAPGDGLETMIPMTVWVDGDGRLRRLSLDAAGFALQLDITGLGEPVTIELPAEESVWR